MRCLATGYDSPGTKRVFFIDPPTLSFRGLGAFRKAQVTPGMLPFSMLRLPLLHSHQFNSKIDDY
jgi:hypothetical protein